MANQEFGKQPGQGPYFGDRELAELYVNGTIHDAYFGDHGEDPLQRLRRFSGLVEEEETGRNIATRIVDEFDIAGMLWQLNDEGKVPPRVINFSSSAVQQELSAQMQTFLSLPEDQRTRFVDGLRDRPW